VGDAPAILHGYDLGIWREEMSNRTPLERLEGHIKLLRLVLISCEEKLELYRDHSDGQYHGGAEHTSLIGRIKAAMAVTEPKDD